MNAEVKPEKTAYQKLPRRHQRFVDEFVDCGKAAESMRRIGFKGRRPDIAGWKIKCSPGVQEAIEERSQQAIQEAGVNSVRVLTEAARVAFFDHRRLFDAEGKLIPTHQLPDDVAAGLAGIEIIDIGDGEERTAGRLSKYRAWPKVEALNLLGKYLKILSERHEITGKDGAPLAPPIINIGFGNGGPGDSSAEGS
jgi:phage terminase small subunit